MKENPIFPQDTSPSLNTSLDRQYISLPLLSSPILQLLNTTSAHNTLVPSKSKASKNMYPMNRVQATINFINRIFPNLSKAKRIHLPITRTLVSRTVTEEIMEETRVILKGNTGRNDYHNF